MFEYFGFDVLEMAKNGEEAVKLYKSFFTKPDLIIMDHQMPLKSGLEATKEILQIHKNAKVIIISADKTIKKLSYSIGAICFIKKPFNVENLIKKINKVFTKKSKSI